MRRKKNLSEKIGIFPVSWIPDSRAFTVKPNSEKVLSNSKNHSLPAWWSPYNVIYLFPLYLSLVKIVQDLCSWGEQNNCLQPLTKFQLMKSASKQNYNRWNRPLYRIRNSQKINHKICFLFNMDFNVTLIFFIALKSIILHKKCNYF